MVITMILVTGATGTIGSNVVRILTEKGVRPRAMTRTPDRVPAGAEAVLGDFEDAASLGAAVDGVSAVFLLTAPGSHVPDHDAALLKAAVDAGVSKIVKLSAIGTGQVGFETTSGWHLPGEQAIQASGLTWTMLRPSMFASNSLGWADQIRAGEPIPSVFGDGTNGVVDPRDVAAVAVEALLSDEHAGQAYTLTGPELVSLAEQAAQLTEVLGRAVKTVSVPPEQLREGFRAQGMTDAFIDDVLKGYDFVRNGGNAILTGDVERVLGRPPGTFKAWAEDHREAFS
jgi:uncharacterized protein YbjT (DUF2867 family)